ncbi:MAG TPA: DUF3180 domain-containing protein [Homoserinimonas sp.]|nr:DUF3180 domain-containing protein [Homoserinimonas sp.]
MKRTSALSLAVFAVVGLALGVLVQVWLAQTGQPGVQPPLTLAIGLSLIGLVDIALAWPIRKVAKGTAKARVDPFYATRVVVLAKASSITGALLAGAAAGFALYLLSRTMPPVGSIGFFISMFAGAVVLMVCGLVAEHMCKLPPDEPEKNQDKKPAEA